MNYIYLGIITSTHGIKGEIKIKSNFLEKDLVFKKDFKIYIGDNKTLEVINSYRPHKGFDMITLKGINDINEVLKYKGLKVYINRDDLNLKDEEFLITDLIGFKIINDNKEYGIVSDIVETKANILLYVIDNKPYYIPYINEFIKEVNLAKKQIIVDRVGELDEI